MFARVTLLALCVIALSGASHLSEGLVAQRESRVVHLGAKSEATPLLAFTTVVLGGFRGIIADLLWLRTTALQDEGRYVELVQLSDWITKFEPRASQAWAFHAWNMAYNVCAMMPTQKEKWRWVRNGLVLLRDQGLVYNPNDPVLCTELALLYQHKIGYPIDEAHTYYKMQLAREMHEVFQGAGGGLAARADLEPLLWREHRLDLGAMQALEARYGTLDWRVPESHALYWAQQGLEASPEGRDLKCAHLILNALVGSFFSGRLEFTGEGDSHIRRPNLALADSVVEAYRDMTQTYELPALDEALNDFVLNAIPVLEANGDSDKAREFRALLNEVP